MQPSRFEFIPATFTPLTEDDAIDLDSIPRYVDFLHREGLRSAFINGTTGEGLSLTTEERLKLAEAWLTHAKRKLGIIVHVGDNCIRNAERLAHHAESHGAVAISCMAPGFFKPRDANEVLDFIEPIAAAAPKTKFYYYHLPSMTGVHLDIAEFIPKAIERIPTFVGIKYTHENLNEFQRCSSLWGAKCRMLFGRDELLLPALGYGARGGVGSIYGLIPQTFAELSMSFDDGQFARARELASQVNQFIEALKQVGVIPAGKEMLAKLGIGSGAVRLPLQTLDISASKDVLSAVAEIPLDCEKWRPRHKKADIHMHLSVGSTKQRETTIH